MQRLAPTPGALFLNWVGQCVPASADFRVAGRSYGVDYTLWPLSQGELHAQQERFLDGVFAERLPASKGGGAFDLQDVVLAGMYPETIQRPAGKRRDAWFSAYITALLQRDVRDLANIDGLIEMPRLLSLLAARVVCAASTPST